MRIEAEVDRQELLQLLVKKNNTLSLKNLLDNLLFAHVDVEQLWWQVFAVDSLIFLIFHVVYLHADKKKFLLHKVK